MNLEQKHVENLLQSLTSIDADLGALSKRLSGLQTTLQAMVAKGPPPGPNPGPGHTGAKTAGLKQKLAGGTKKLAKTTGK